MYVHQFTIGMQCNAPVPNENKTRSRNASQVALSGECMDALSEKS